MPQTDALKREEVEDLFSFRDGFHDVDWPRAAALIERNFDPLDRPKGFHDLVLLWLERLRNDLGGSYAVVVADELAILCDQPPDTARWLLSYAESVMSSVRDMRTEIHRNRPLRSSK